MISASRLEGQPLRKAKKAGYQKSKLKPFHFNIVCLQGFFVFWFGFGVWILFFLFPRELCLKVNELVISSN